MKASELIQRLAEIIQDGHDKEVTVLDATRRYCLPLDSVKDADMSIQLRMDDMTK